MTTTVQASEHDLARLERYRPLVTDWAAFAAAVARPRPTCVVANRNRLTTAALLNILRAEGRPAEPLGWSEAALRVPAEARPALWWPYQAGLCNIMEEASLLPVQLLDPRPGERVLDLCAAPGGKAALIALALGARGTVVANDKDARRLAGIRDKMKRLGLVNLTATVHDGGDYPPAAGPFDRVLVDAPCTAEGTRAHRGASYDASGEGFRSWLAGQQRALLRRALRLVRPGGRVVYATCSFAPEENEAVVDAILREFGAAVRALPPQLDGLDFSPGVTEWRGQRFHPELRHGVRLWPHLSGTGGFFAIALERREDGGAEAARPDIAQALGAPVDIADKLAAMRDRYGLAAGVFDDLRFHRRGDESHAVAADHAPPARPRPAASGIPFLRVTDRGAKPATPAALLFGDRATRNVVDLDDAQAAAYLGRETVEPDPEQLAACAERGHVIVRRRGRALGVGFLRPGPPARLESQYPRAWVPHGRRAD